MGAIRKKVQTHFTAKTRYVTEKQLAEILQKSRIGFQQDRFKGQGVPWIRYGGKIYYDLVEVDKYMKEHTIRPEG